MSNKRKSKKALITGFVILLIVGIVIGSVIYFVFFKSSGSKKSVVLKEIKDYGYTLEDRDTKLMASTFSELEDILSQDNVDYKKYAEALGKLFVIDLYTISNKLDTYDVGGCEYIHPDDLTEYKHNVTGTLYNYIGYIDDREFKMPEVKTVEVDKIEETTFKYNEDEYDGYLLTISWDYVKDLGYDDKALVTIFKADKKLYIGDFITSEAANE